MPLGEIDVEERRRAVDAGRVDEDVDRPESLFHLASRRLDRLWDRRVDDDRGGPAASTGEGRRAPHPARATDRG